MRSDEKDILPYIEKKQHGDVLLPFAVYGTNMPHLYRSYPLHCHEELEVVYADCGHCRYTVSGKDIDLRFGDILVMMPWVLHSFQLTDPKDYFIASTYLISLNMVNTSAVDICSSRYFSPMLDGSCSDYCVISMENEHHHEFKEIVDGMFHVYLDHVDFFEIKLKSLISDLLYRLLAYGLIEMYDKPIEGSDVRTVRRVVDYISENYRETITLGKLADLVSMSETGLSRLFRSITGLSCIDYVIEYRMSKAMSMVRFTDKPIIEIAYEVGFNNISYFNRTFKKHFHQTPSQCRKEASGEGR
jgi:AraC-like DNA-binding protein